MAMLAESLVCDGATMAANAMVTVAATERTAVAKRIFGDSVVK